MLTLEEAVSEVNSELFPQGVLYHESHAFTALASSYSKVDNIEMDKAFSRKLNTGFMWDDAVLGLGIVAAKKFNSKSFRQAIVNMPSFFDANIYSTKKLLAAITAATGKEREEIAERFYKTITHFSTPGNRESEFMSCILTLIGALKHIPQEEVIAYMTKFPEHAVAPKNHSFLASGILNDRQHIDKLIQYKDPRVRPASNAAVLSAAEEVTPFKFNQLANLYLLVRGNFSKDGMPKAFATIAIAYHLRNLGYELPSPAPPNMPTVTMEKPATMHRIFTP